MFGGNTLFAELLPKDLQKLLPTPTLIPINEQRDKNVKGINITPTITESPFSTASANPNIQLVKVIRIADGDTITIEGGEKLRYIGINTPESVDPRRPVECFGKEASLRNKELVEGKIIGIEKDVSQTDRFGRLLRYVYVGDVMINEQLVREGYAFASAYPPDVKYQERLQAAEQDAKENRRGLWSTCPR